MKNDNPSNKIYNSIKGLTEALGQAGLYKEEEVKTPDEIKGLKAKVTIHSWILIGVAIVVVVAFAGFVIDAIYFHITNNRYDDELYKIKVNTEILKNNHPELFK